MKHRILIALLIGSLALPASAATFGLKAAYLMPSEQAFKDVYGSGLMYGAEAGFSLAGPVKLWIDGMYFTKKGKLSYTGEETTLTLIPIGAGVRADLTAGKLAPYVGAGLRYTMYKEVNVIGTAKKNGLGFVGFAGLSVQVTKGVLLDLRAAYSSCKLTPADFKIDVGGFEIGGGLVFAF